MNGKGTTSGDNESIRDRPSIVAEFVIDRPIYATVLDELPETQLVVEGMTACNRDTILVTFWAESDDFETFEHGLKYEEAIHTIEMLSGQVDNQKLYQIRLSAAATTYWEWTNLGGVLLACTLDHDGMWMCMRFPNRSALAACREYCTERDCSFSLKGLQTTTAGRDGGSNGLTTTQEEILTAALDEGYFNIPRDTTMDELADLFDISNQAASERLRRGMSNVLGNRPLQQFE